MTDMNNTTTATNDNNNEEEVNATILEFLYTFPNIATEHQIENIMEDLSDGVVLFEALSEISPEYFDPTTIARHLGDNWALKNSNLRKLVRNLEQYYHVVLKRDYNDNEWNQIDISNMARYHHRAPIITLCQLVIAASVTCPEKHIFVQRIMSMSPESQVIMKDLIQQSLQQLTTYTNEDEQNDFDNNNIEDGGDHNITNNDEDEENELVFNDSQNENYNDDGQYQQPTKLFHSAKGKRTTTAAASSISGNNGTVQQQQQYDDVVKELTSVKLQYTISTEEFQKSEKKLSTIIEDLQDRLMKRQDELIDVEEELKETVSELEETKSKLVAIEEEKAILEDDLDVMKSKAQQLYKAEATVVAYKKKLESMGTMNQQMEDLEGQAEKYLRQIMTLESEVKKSTTLQKTVSAQEDVIQKLEKTITEQAATIKSTMSDITELKNRLSATESTKKLYEDELNELRMKQQHLESELQQLSSSAVATGIAGSSIPNSTSNSMTSEQREKMMRLEIENQQLREQLATSSQQSDTISTPTSTKVSITNDDTTTPIAVAISTPTPSSDSIIEGLKLEIQRLTDAYAVKEQENIKIASDKDKLEAYTKRTLAKFQDKYLVALQECKAKLKEKQDKIELLEKRSQTERNTQKREERLLSSTIYELGLGIMQNKLKGSTSSITSNTPTKS